MRRARSQLNKLTQQHVGNFGLANAHGAYTNGIEVDEIQRRLNAMNQHNMLAQQQPFFNDPVQNPGFQQPAPIQPYPAQPFAQQQAANPYTMPNSAPAMAAMDTYQPQPAYETANPQLDNIKSALEQMSSKLHAINHANAGGSSNNQNAILQQGEVLKQHYNHINNELQGLKTSIASMASSHGSSSDLQTIQETLSANYRAIIQQLESVQPAQIDNSVFSSALEASHKEIAQQILDMKQSIDTSSNNPNIYAKTLEASHDDITKRLDDMHNALQTSIATPDLYIGSIENNHRDISQQITSLQEAVEKLENSPSEAATTDLSSIEMRLEEITRAVVALSLEDGSINNLERIEARVSDMAKTLDGFSMPEVKSDEASFERLEAKLSDISKLMQASSPDLSSIEAEMAKFSEKFENFSAVSVTSPITGDENNALLKRMDQLVEQISQSQSHLADTTTNDTIVSHLTQISGAIDKLSSPVDAQSVGGNINNDVIVKQLDQIAGAIDQLAATSAESVSTTNQFASLEQQLSLISSQMDSSTPSGSLSLDPITSRLSGIEEQLGANRDITIELATKAAEDAVKMSVEAMPQMAASGVPMDSAALNSMSDILAQLNQETQVNNSKNVEAFGAVTQTLNLMVDRLGSIEAGLSGQSASTPLMQTPAFSETAQEKAEPHNEQVTEAEAVPTEIVEQPQVQTKSPAADLVKAARMAADTEKVMPEAPSIMTLKEPILDTMTDIPQPMVATVDDESIALPEVETPEMAMETMPEVKDETSSESGHDVALEPGTGGPDLAALVRQANERRKNNKSSEIESAGTDFIAAARRAAQAAAQEAGAVEEEIEENTKKSFFASLPELFAKRKKVIIMAAAAALLIAVAGTIVPKFLGGDNNQLAAVDNSQPIEQKANPVLPQASTVAPQNTLSQIAPVPATDISVTPEQEIPVPQITEPDPVKDAILTNTDLNTQVATSTFDLPEELNFVTAELKEAVQKGEPAALFEVGKIYTDGAGIDKDLAKAAQWYESAANLGFAPAQYIIGNFNEKGLGVNQDPAIAAQWYEKAAKGGNIIAMHNLAVLTATPNALTEQPDMEEAFKWFSNAADYGVRDSQVNAGIFHTKGFGTEVNLVEAYKWFAIAAKAGDKDASNKRDVIANAIQPDQLEIAKSLVKEWKPLDVVQAANEVPTNKAWKAGTAVANAPLKIDRNTIAQTQSLLSRVGFNAGVADGIMGQKTRNAIAAFQKKAGLPVNGRIDAEFLKALKAVAI